MAADDWMNSTKAKNVNRSIRNPLQNVAQLRTNLSQTTEFWIALQTRAVVFALKPSYVEQRTARKGLKQKRCF
jgi:hypothetical protein